MKFTTGLVAFGIALGASFISVSSSAIAQEISASHISAAKRAMTASRSTERLDQILPQMAQEAKAEFIRNRPDQEAELSAVVDDAAISVAGRRGDLENEVALIFAKVFSEEELVVIADFYSSEAGQKFLKESPIVIREMQAASRVWANGLRRDLGAAIQEKLIAAELQ